MKQIKIKFNNKPLLSKKFFLVNFIIICIILFFVKTKAQNFHYLFPNFKETNEIKELTPHLHTEDMIKIINPESSIDPLAIIPENEVVVTLRAINFIGNTQYTKEILSALLADYIEKSHNLKALNELTNIITNHYRNNGFAFSRALLAPQDITDGVLTIEIIEGRYGNIKVIGDQNYVDQAELFLKKLKKGNIIQIANLTRVSLILENQPGFKTKPLLKPGQKEGTGDLEVSIERDKLYSGTTSLNNYGNYYTGSNLYNLNLNINHPFLFGDQLKLNMVYTEEDMWLGGVNYNLPLGISGLRAKVGYVESSYVLGQEFAAAKLSGTGKTISAGLRYPLILSKKNNLSIENIYNHKIMNSLNNITETKNTTTSDSLNSIFNFSTYDQLMGGGTIYGSFTYTYGKLTLPNSLRATDSTTAKTEGHFDKFILRMNRIQKIRGKFTLFANISAQLAANNLNSSEKFSIGGPNEVRAYPAGEAYGDEGVLSTIELRYSANSKTSLYAFYDAAEINVNHTTWDSTNNKRVLEGQGIGLRFNTADIIFEASSAWRTKGTFSDNNQKKTPQIWLNIKYNFGG